MVGCGVQESETSHHVCGSMCLAVSGRCEPHMLWMRYNQCLAIDSILCVKIVEALF